MRQLNVSQLTFVIKLQSQLTSQQANAVLSNSANQANNIASFIIAIVVQDLSATQSRKEHESLNPMNSE